MEGAEPKAGARTQPRVSIGMPVYNGERYLDAAITGLLAQTFDDLEIIVSDNASTDHTAAILTRLAEQDARVRVHSFAKNLGPAANYNKVAELARGEYFMWAAADDVHAPAFVETAVGHLDADPTAVLAYAGTRIIDGSGAVVRDYDYQPDLDAGDPADRLSTLINVDHRRHGAFEIFGLMRSTDLRAALPQGAYARSDSVILARMVLRGRFVRDSERLFLNRDHGERSVRTVPSRTFNGNGAVVRRLGAGPIPSDEWWDPSRRNRVVWPEWRLLVEYRRAVRDAPLSDTQRSACAAVVRRFAMHHLPKLGRDAAINAELALRRSAHAARRSPTSTDVPLERAVVTAPTEHLLEISTSANHAS